MEKQKRYLISVKYSDSFYKRIYKSCKRIKSTKVYKYYFFIRDYDSYVYRYSREDFYEATPTSSTCFVCFLLVLSTTSSSSESDEAPLISPSSFAVNNYFFSRGLAPCRCLQVALLPLAARPSFCAFGY